MQYKKTITVRYLNSSDKYIGIQFKGKYLEDLGLKNGDKIHLIATDQNDIVLTKDENFSKINKVKNCLSSHELRELLDLMPEIKFSELRLKVVVLLILETKLSIDDIVNIKNKQFSENYDLLYIEDINTNLYKAVELSNNLSRTIRNFKNQKFANSCATDYLIFNTSTNSKLNPRNIKKQLTNLNKELSYNLTLDLLQSR